MNLPSSLSFGLLGKPRDARLVWDRPSWRKPFEWCLLGSLLIMVLAIPLSESVKNIGLGLAVVFWLLGLSVGRSKRLHLGKVGWAHAAFLGAAAVSAIFALYPYQGLRGVWDVVRTFLVFVLLLNGIKTRRALQLVCGAFLLSVLFGSLWALGDFAAGYSEATKAGLLGKRHAVQVHSLGHPNHTATYLAMMLAFSLGHVVSLGEEKWFRWLSGVTAVVVMVALLLTFSRSAMLASVVMILGLGVMHRRGRKLASVSVLVLFLALAGAGMLKENKMGVFSFFHPIKSLPLADRFVVWEGILRMLEERPIVGMGPRNFNYIPKERYGIPRSQAYFNHAHSLYFNVAAEMGLLGVATLAVWLVIYGATGWRLYNRATSDHERALGLASLGVLAVLTVSGLVTTTLHTEGAMAFSAIMALALAAREVSLVGRETHGRF